MRALLSATGRSETEALSKLAKEERRAREIASQPVEICDENGEVIEVIKPIVPSSLTFEIIDRGTKQIAIKLAGHTMTLWIAYSWVRP